MSIERREKIIKKAAELFQSKGYAASSMRDLAHALGIEPPSLYAHIKSKEEILQRLCFEMADAFRASLQEVENQNVSASQKLRMGILGHVKVMNRNLTSSSVFMIEHRHLSQPYLGRFLLMRINYINRFKVIIKGGIRTGEFKKSIDVKLAVMTLFSSLNWMPEWYHSRSQKNVNEIGEQLAEMLTEGLKTG